jgi:cytochrome c-type biogenesis protein CcmH
MSEVDWTPAVAVLAAGLVIGALVLWRVARRGAAVPAPVVPPLELRDLEGKYDALLAQLRELDDVKGKRTPEQVAQDRHALEHAAARALRDIDSLGRAVPAQSRKATPKDAQPAPVAPSATALQGFLWGVGSVGVLGLLFYFVSQQAGPRAPGGSATGNTPSEAQAPGAAPDDAELRQQRAAVERSPEDVDVRLELVRLLLVRQDLMAVFQETQAVLQRQPGNARALSYQALVRLAMGQAQQAEGMLKQALAKDPNLLDAYLHLMLVYVRSERPAEADKVMKDVSRRFPDRAASIQQLLSEMRERAKDEAPAAADAAADPHANVAAPGTSATSGTAAPRGSAAAAGGKKVAGVLELDPSIKGQRYAGAIVFVTLREGGFGAGPPLAAKRLQASGFPMPFEIGSSDSMSGESLPDDLLVEARIDADGDPMTRPRTDPYASADRVRSGASDVKLVLKPRTP